MNHLLELGFSKSLSHWIGSNLKKHGDHLTWAFNLDVAIQMFNSFQYISYYFRDQFEVENYENLFPSLLPLDLL